MNREAQLISQRERQRSPEESALAEWHSVRQQLLDGGYMREDGTLTADLPDWTPEQLSYVQDLQRAEQSSQVAANNTERDDDVIREMVPGAEEAHQIGAQIAQLEARLARTRNSHDADSLKDDISRLKAKQNRAMAA